MDLDYLRIYPKLSIDACKGKTVTMILNGQVERILPESMREKYNSSFEMPSRAPSHSIPGKNIPIVPVFM